MKRVFDVIIALIASVVLMLPVVVIMLLIRFTSAGTVLYWSDRVGKNNKIFRMPKFRTMDPYTPVIATHLLNDSSTYVTPIGSFMRRTSLDEVPQLWSILKGDMSFVGPRPALFNQYDLIELRTIQGVSKLVPGITGLAQVSGRDELTIPEKVDYDVEYMKKRSLFFDLKIILRTFIITLMRSGVDH